MKTYKDGDIIGVWQGKQTFRIRTGRGLIFLTYTTGNWSNTEIIRASDKIYTQDDWLPEDFFQSGYVPFLAKESAIRQQYWEGGYDLNGNFTEGGTNIAGRLPVTGEVIAINTVPAPNPWPNPSSNPTPTPAPTSPGSNPTPNTTPTGIIGDKIKALASVPDSNTPKQEQSNDTAIWWYIGGGVAFVLIITLILVSR